MELIWAFDSLDARALLDILLVAIFFFSSSFLFRGTQALALLRGTLVMLVGLILLSNLLQLQALGWILQGLLTILAVAIPVIFQPELRRALERLGSGDILATHQTPDSVRNVIIDEICQATERLSERRHGALIVLQRNTNLDDYIRTGIPLNSEVNAAILLTIFWPKTELHDGAAIIDTRGRLASASAVLPLTASRNLPSRKMGTRHRAALGISEVSDALCVIVSEETGKVAVTNGGRMVSRLDTERLRTLLNAFYGSERHKPKTVWGRASTWLQTQLKQIQSRMGQS